MARFMFIVAIAFLAGTSVHAHTNRPNMVFFLTDDLDLELGSMMKPLVKTRQLIADGGVTFANAYVTTPLCCPSRSSILTGRYVHNVGVFNNSLSGGCSSQHWQRGPERSAFAVDLQRAGYETFYAGKYLNRYGHKKAGGVQHVPPGWTNWNGLVGNSVYYNYTLSINGTAEKHGDSPDKDYLTDVLRAKALSFLEGRTDQRRPFFMMLSTPAPHAPFTPAVRHRDAFPNVKAPRTPAFNISVNGTKHWLVRQAIYPIPEDVVSWIDEAYRNRLRTLLSVDDMVADVLSHLMSKELLNNTYVFFSSDNGYHLGQFSMPKDKRHPYETDIHVPLLVRGPGIAAGRVEQGVALNVDLAPTFLDLAGLPPHGDMDGASLKPLLLGGASRDSWPRQTFLVEYAGEGQEGPYHGECPVLQGVSGCDPEVECECQDSVNNTYLCTRHISAEANTKFCTFDDDEGFVESYNLTADPHELENLFFSGGDALRGYDGRACLGELRFCRRESCYVDCWKSSR
ncbi:N-acetylglucosamine-6-sulfatase [Rhipicephalus sanguineus]|uniref:N-acetylglucosamine-6-sulfatase n=1 Tax=Rhipicephalus sanguineus TaxID=34632 RepID=UPI001893D9D4|nr:N-acetylglucosamine-6-sulfatase [Rhipicephalus sanguineus]